MTFDGVPALVVAGDARELVVVAPASARSQAETLVPVVVQAGGRSSAAGPAFTLQRLVGGSWVPRFFAGAVGEGGTPGQATVGTEIAPVLILSAKDESRSVGERTLIERVRGPLAPAPSWVRLGIGDDAALVTPVARALDVITTDALVEQRPEIALVGTMGYHIDSGGRRYGEMKLNRIIKRLGTDEVHL